MGENLQRYAVRSIKIKKRLDVFIIEKQEGKSILKGSHIFCGICGESIGKTKSSMQSPFTSKDLMNNMKHLTIKQYKLGVKHELCGHYLFTFSKQWDFISLKNYNK